MWYEKDHVFRLSLTALYATTLSGTQQYRPWACDAYGRFVGLEYRKEFAHLVISKNGNPTEREMMNTAYWHLLNAPLSSPVRDGGRNWVYLEPRTQMLRFQMLVRSLQEHGYVTNEQNNAASRFNASALPMVEKHANGDVKTLRYEDRKYPGLIRVSSLNGTYQCINGNHRLATMVALTETGAFHESDILVYYLRPTTLIIKVFHRALSTFERIKRRG